MKILLLVAGGIAAYKSLYLVRLLKKQGFEVQVAMSESACEFVTPLSFEVLSNNKVITTLFGHDQQNGINHIDLVRNIDKIIIAPATANLISKMAGDIADDLLSTILLAREQDVDVYLAPAMNKQMYAKIKPNLKILKTKKIKILPTEIGEQACGEVGEGRMLEPQNILEYLLADLPLYNKNFILTAGPTHENLDPIRFLSNYSSGKMGYAIATALAHLGAKVHLVSGPTSIVVPKSINLYKVVSANDMLEAVFDLLKTHKNNLAGFIAAAAVADYRPVTSTPNKIKKNQDSISIEFIRNPDILKQVAEFKKAEVLNFTLVGFCAETENLIKNAKEKIQTKNLDFIVANLINTQNPVFNDNKNEVILLDKNFNLMTYGLESKKTLAKKIIRHIFLVVKTSCKD